MKKEKHGRYLSWERACASWKSQVQQVYNSDTGEGRQDDPGGPLEQLA